MAEEGATINFCNVFDQDKFKELILYIADKCTDDPDYGATKLNKILFYSEFQSYGRYGESITNMPYFRLENGPAPKYLTSIRDEMIEAKEIVIQNKPRFKFTQQRIVPLRQANLSKLSARDISIVDEVVNALGGANADMVSRYSHLEIGYLAAGDREEIPYETVFLSNKPLTEYDIKHGLELAEQYNWSI